MVHLNRFLVRAAVLAAIVAPSAASASDGVITITGQIIAQTCTIAGNGGNATFTVTLPIVSTTALAADGAIAGRTPFNIVLSGCSVQTGNVATYFEPGLTVDILTGRLKNSGTATNVQIGLLNGDASAISLGLVRLSQNSKVATLAAGAATLPYMAQYVATSGAAGAGTVTTSVTYTLVYN